MQATENKLRSSLTPHLATNVADLVHGALPLRVTGAYVPPLLFGHSRQMMNPAPVHPTYSSLSSSPQEMRTLDDSKTSLLHVLRAASVPTLCGLIEQVMPGHA
jgi:hypothetical protein